MTGVQPIIQSIPGRDYGRLARVMDLDYSKRDYLLPPGCKDLIDALKLAPPGSSHAPLAPGEPASTMQVLLVPNPTSVAHLAALLGQKPFKVIADLMELGVFASVKQLLPFETVAAVARKYGYLAKPVPPWRGADNN